MPFYQMVNSSRAGTYSEFIVGTIYKWKGKKKKKWKREEAKGREEGWRKMEGEGECGKN